MSAHHLKNGIMQLFMTCHFSQNKEMIYVMRTRDFQLFSYDFESKNNYNYNSFSLYIPLCFCFFFLTFIAILNYHTVSWFSFILGSNFIFRSFKLIIIKLYSQTFTQLNRECHWLILGHVALTKIKCILIVIHQAMYPAWATLQHMIKAWWKVV